MKVFVTGKQDPRVMLAIAALGADVVTTNVFEIKPLEITGVWFDEPAIVKPETRRTYGPPVKGRGGKLKRW